MNCPHCKKELNEICFFNETRYWHKLIKKDGKLFIAQRPHHVEETDEPHEFECTNPQCLKSITDLIGNEINWE